MRESVLAFAALCVATHAAVTLAVVSVATLPSLAQFTEEEEGELAFNSACGTCHTLRPGDNRLGPHLNNVIGRKAGSLPDYAGYSSSMKQSGIVWDEKTLDQFAANPEAVVGNNNMKPFAGVPDDEQRATIIEFIQLCHDCSPDCPAPKKCKPAPG